MSAACECGAEADCRPVWHEALAAEQLDPAMGAFHNPLVCAFVLQHRSQMRPALADGQYRFLQLFVDQGIEALGAVARRARARNRGHAGTPDLDELAAYEPFPERAAFPESFAVSVHHLREPGGGFVAQGHRAYGERMRDLAAATVEGWASSGH